MGKRLNYGNLLLKRNDSGDAAIIKNIPSPNDLVVTLNDMFSTPHVGILPTGKQESREAKLPPALIAGGENQFVEFKASLIWDYHREVANKELYTPVMKNIVAFLNSDGGDVLIGVSDDGELLGLEPDLSTMNKGNYDGFENIFNMAFNKMIGVEYRTYVTVTFPEVDGINICRVTVAPSTEPAYLQYKGDERFYIRAGNASQPLPVSKATKYVQTHFKTRGVLVDE